MNRTPHPDPLPIAPQTPQRGEGEELFPGLPPSSPPKRDLCTLENYKASVKERYHGRWAHDALANWHAFEEYREQFRAWCSHYKKDAYMYVGQKAHNPEGTLSSMVWMMQAAIEPDKSRLHPCLDFEDHFQTVFIRRGLIIYLTLLLKEAEPRPGTEAEPRTEPGVL